MWKTMIKILFKEELSCPIFNCDICGDMIGEPDEGAAMFADLATRRENAKTEVLHVHKGKCYEIAEKRFDTRIEWQPLGAHLYFLCANTDVDGRYLEWLKRIDGTPTA